MSEDKLNDLKEKVGNPKTEEDLCAVLHTIFDRERAHEMSEEEMFEVLQNLHLPEEVSQKIEEEEEEEVLKK